VIFVLTSDAASHYEICETAKEGAQHAAKECARYNIISFAFREIGAHLDIVSALLTAGATAFIARYTFTLKKSTDRLWEAGNDQFKLAREEFISTHRPKIIVWSLDFGGDANGDEPIPATFRYVNSGDSPAVITAFGSRFMRLSEPAIPSGLQFNHQEIDPPIEVESGMHGFRLTEETLSPDEIVQSGIWDTDKLVCVGYVLYRDRNGTRRQVGFCREFDAKTGRWIPLKDDEYEYSY
jgi:hypothetical protein